MTRKRYTEEQIIAVLKEGAGRGSNRGAVPQAWGLGRHVFTNGRRNMPGWKCQRRAEDAPAGG